VKPIDYDKLQSLLASRSDALARKSCAA
jgi:hypothetical protein